jgi:pimeloyl-ACP methyl ester carboxylesterase
VSWFDIARCAFKANSLTWKVAILAIGLIVFGLTIAFWIGSTLLVAWLGTTLYYHPGFTWFRWYQPFLVIVTIVALRFVLKRVVRFFDFFADVAVYIARPEQTLRHEETLARIVEYVSRHFPNTRLLLIGHSLGSVLVTHALDHMNLSESDQRLILVTLGSPLRRMSRIFPQSIHSPDRIAKDCANNARILFWVNLWRDRDFVGREIGLRQPEIFAETSLGDGPHWDMWSDERLWRSLVALLPISERSDLQSVAASWDMENLVAWPENRPEIYRAAFILLARRVLVAPIVFIGAIAATYWGPWGRWFSLCRQDAAWEIWTGWVIVEALSVLLLFASAMPHDSVQDRAQQGTDFSRRFLGALRRSKALSDTVTNVLLFSIIGLGVFLHLAMPK